MRNQIGVVNANIELVCKRLKIPLKEFNSAFAATRNLNNISDLPELDKVPERK